MDNRYKRNTLILAALLLILPRPVWADIRIGSKVSVHAEGAEITSPAERHVVILCKNGKVRQEFFDGTVLLYDQESDKVYTLDTENKTFFARSFKEFIKTRSAIAAGKKHNVRIDVEAKLTDVKNCSTYARVFAGKQTIPHYVYVKAKPRSTGIAGMLGGVSRGGSAMGGGLFGIVRGGLGRGGSRTLSLGNGTLWVTPVKNALPLKDKETEVVLLALVREMAPPNVPLVGSLVDALKKSKQLLLSSQIILRHPKRSKESKEADNSSIVATMEVTTIEENLALEDSLFVVPEEYKGIAPPN